MKNYQFYVDQKVTSWNRTFFDIDAENYEEAKNKAVELIKSGEVCEQPWESIFDTTELMSKEENDGQPTEEMYSNNEEEEGQLIYQN